MGNLYQELKRRKVFRVAALYAVVAWVLIQVTDVVLPTFGAPEWVNQTIIFLFFLGFLPTLIAAWAYEITPDGVKPDVASQAATQSSSPQNQGLVYATFALVLLVAGFQVADRFLFTLDTDSNTTPETSYQVFPSQAIRANLVLGEALIAPNGIYGYLALSPDGSKLAYTNRVGEASNRIRIRDLATGSSVLLSEENLGDILVAPEFSPSGDRLLMLSVSDNQTKLYVTDSSGSAARLLTSSEGLDYATWFSDREIMYGAENGNHVISLNDGESTPLQIPHTETEFVGFPKRVLNTPWIIYTNKPRNTQYQRGRIDAFNIETKQTKTLISRGYNARLTASGHIVFMRDGNLWATPIDTLTMETTGNGTMVEQGVEHETNRGFASYTFSNNGRLLYRRGLNGYRPVGSGLELAEISGSTIAHSLPENAIHGRFSPNGESIAFTLQDSIDTESDIVIYDIAGQILSRRTFSGQADRPLWSPDGNTIVYREQDGSSFGLWRMNADGSGQAEQLLSAQKSLSPTSFSHDGTQLIFSEGTGLDTVVNQLTLDEVEVPFRPIFVEFDSSQDAAEISPDGRWILYGSDELGSSRIFVRRFPDIEGGGKWLVSDISAREAHWGPDNSIYLIGPEGTIYRVPIDTQTGFRAGQPELISKANRHVGRLEPNFNVSPDGQYILYSSAVLEEFIESDTLVLVENWFDRLLELAPIYQN